MAVIAFIRGFVRRFRRWFSGADFTRESVSDLGLMSAQMQRGEELVRCLQLLHDSLKDLLGEVAKRDVASLRDQYDSIRLRLDAKDAAIEATAVHIEEKLLRLTHLHGIREARLLREIDLLQKHLEISLARNSELVGQLQAACAVNAIAQAPISTI